MPSKYANLLCNQSHINKLLLENIVYQLVENFTNSSTLTLISQISALKGAQIHVQPVKLFIYLPQASNSVDVVVCFLFCYCFKNKSGWQLVIRMLTFRFVFCSLLKVMQWLYSCWHPCTLFNCIVITVW